MPLEASSRSDAAMLAGAILIGSLECGLSNHKCSLWALFQVER